MGNKFHNMEDGSIIHANLDEIEHALILNGLYYYKYMKFTIWFILLYLDGGFNSSETYESQLG